MLFFVSCAQVVHAKRAPFFAARFKYLMTLFFCICVLGCSSERTTPVSFFHFLVGDARVGEMVSLFLAGDVSNRTFLCIV